MALVTAPFASANGSGESSCRKAFSSTSGPSGEAKVTVKLLPPQGPTIMNSARRAANTFSFLTAQNRLLQETWAADKDNPKNVWPILLTLVVVERDALNRSIDESPQWVSQDYLKIDSVMVEVLDVMRFLIFYRNQPNNSYSRERYEERLNGLMTKLRSLPIEWDQSFQFADTSSASQSLQGRIYEPIKLSDQARLELTRSQILWSDWRAIITYLYQTKPTSPNREEEEFALISIAIGDYLLAQGKQTHFLSQQRIEIDRALEMKNFKVPDTNEAKRRLVQLLNAQFHDEPLNRQQQEEHSQQ